MPFFPSGIIANPITREDEITNVQILIDSLQHDVLRADLSHITGEAIMNGNLLSIRYLIEILAGLLECVMEQIDSEGSTDLEGSSLGRILMMYVWIQGGPKYPGGHSF